MPNSKTRASETALAPSKHIHVTEQFRARILTGELKPGDRLPSYNQVRTQFGVHTNTMEKVYAKLEAEGLIVRRNGSGTYVAPWFEGHAQRAKHKGHGIIGLSGAGFHFRSYSSYWAQVMGGAREVADRAGMHLMMLDAASPQGWEKADGVLFCDWDNHRVPRKRPPGLPLVSMMTPLPGIASVTANEESGTFQATQHLISLGHRRIAYLHAHEEAYIGHARLTGYRKALKAAGIRPLKSWTKRMRGRYDVGTKFTSTARNNMLLWLRDDWKHLGCTALLCSNDEAAVGVIDALKQHNIRVPEDVSVVGFDGTQLCDLVSPRLSTVEVPLRDIGAVGVEMLLKQISNDALSDQHRVLPVRFKARQTTAGVPLGKNT
jgi:LacI family transcriptional regulator